MLRFINDFFMETLQSDGKDMFRAYAYYYACFLAYDLVPIGLVNWFHHRNFREHGESAAEILVKVDEFTSDYLTSQSRFN